MMLLGGVLDGDTPGDADGAGYGVDCRAKDVIVDYVAEFCGQGEQGRFVGCWFAGL